MFKTDHFMYAVNELQAGMAWATDCFGVAPAYGGEHVGLGTCNALLSLGDVYLEIIAPDPQQSIAGTFGERIAALSAPGLVTWAVSGNLLTAQQLLEDNSIACIGPLHTQRKTTAGEILNWDLLFPKDDALDGCTPFFIDWLACPHPSETNPQGGSLSSFSIEHPHNKRLQNLCNNLELSISVGGQAAKLEVCVASRQGAVTLTSTPETLALSMI